jgi:hypothetical protein
VSAPGPERPRPPGLPPTGGRTGRSGALRVERVYQPSREAQARALLRLIGWPHDAALLEPVQPVAEVRQPDSDSAA